MLKTIVNAAREGLAGLALRAAQRLGYSPEHWAAIGGRSFALSVSGQNVTIESALKVSAYKRGVELISNYIGKTPFHVRADKAKDKRHPAWSLVRRWAVWDDVSASQFRKTLIIHALTRGNGYGQILRVNGTPTETRILDPDKIVEQLRGGRLVYRIRNTDLAFLASDIIHIRGFGCNGYTGEDPITGYAKDVLGLCLSQQSYAGGYFARGGVSQVYAHSGVPLSKEVWDRLESDSGPLRNALDDPHRIPVLEQIELKTVSLTAQQTQLLESREFGLKDVANILNLTVHKLNGHGTGGYRSLEEESRAFRDDTLDPWLCQFEEQYEKLLTEQQREDETHSVEAVRESLTRTNMADRANYLKTAIGGPWMSPAEGRDIDSLEELPDTEKLYPPPNMTREDPAAAGSRSAAAAPQPAADAENRNAGSGVPAAAKIAALSDVLTRMTKRLTTQATKAAGKPAAWLEFCDGLKERNAVVITDALSPIVALCCATDADTRTAAVCATLIAELDAQFRAAYDRRTADEFPGAIAEICDRAERDARDRAERIVTTWQE